MTVFSRLHGISLRAAAIIAAGLCLIGSAWAISSGNFTYSTAKTGYLTVDPMAMSPDSNDSATGPHINDWTAGLRNFGSSGQCFNAGINLPHGATMKALTIWVGSGVTGTPAATLVRKKLSSQADTILANGDAAFDDNVRHGVNFAIDPANAKVNNVAYSYGLGICLFSQDTFYGARIRYTYTNAGD